MLSFTKRDWLKTIVLPVVLLISAMGFRLQAQEVNLDELIKLIKNEQFKAVDQKVKELLKTNPDNGFLYYYYGNNFLKKYYADTLNVSMDEMCDSARIHFITGIQHDPRNPLNFVGLGEISLLKGNIDEAHSYFDKAKALLPSKKNKIEMEPEQHSTVLVRIADAYVRANVKDTTEVFSLLNEAQKINPNNYELYIVKGDAYINFLNNGSDAIANYNIAQSLNPASPMAKLRIGQLWMRAKQYQLALNYYQEGVKADTSFAPGYKELGFLLSKAGRMDDAKKYFEKFLSLSSGNITARAQFINTLIDLQDYSEAVEQIKKILTTDTTIVDLYRALAYSLYEMGDYENGLTAIQKFFKKEPTSKIRAMDYSYYGRLLAKTKNDSLGARMLITAYDMDSTKSDLLSEAAMCYNRLKEYDSSIRIYQLKTKIGKINALDLYNWGKAYYNMQDYIHADSIFALFSEQQPNYVQGYIWRARSDANLDPDSDLGLAKPIYEKILDVTKDDTVANSKERLEAYYYLAYYYYHKYNLDKIKDKETALKSIEYCNMVLAIDPENERAKQMVEALKRVLK